MTNKNSYTSILMALQSVFKTVGPWLVTYTKTFHEHV